MEILKGLLLINDVDVYDTYGAFLAEKDGADNVNYDSLMAMPELKPVPEVSIPEEEGVRTAAQLSPAFKARDIELQFAIVAENAAEYITRYVSFLRFLKRGADGWLTIKLTDVGLSYKVRLLSAPQYMQVTAMDKRRTAGLFRLKFREPQPTLGVPEEALEK